MDIATLSSQAREAMDKALEHVQSAFKRFRAHQVAPDMVKDLLVDNYGVDAPLYQVSDISKSDDMTLTVKPWDKALLKVIGKVLQENNHYGFSIVHQGDCIRLYRQPPTQESRQMLVQKLAEKKEEGRVAFRAIRKKWKQRIKEAENKDEEKKMEDALQKITNAYLDQLEKLYKAREQAIMKI